jgi:MORN repeat
MQSYEGDWVNGERHGTGTYTYRAAEGMVYTGQWYRYVHSSSVYARIMVPYIQTCKNVQVCTYMYKCLKVTIVLSWLLSAQYIALLGPC